MRNDPARAGLLVEPTHSAAPTKIRQRGLPRAALLRRALVVAVVVGGASYASYAADAFSLGDDTLRVPAGMKPAVRKDVLIKGQNLSDCDGSKNVSAQDLFVEGPPDLSVAFENIRSVASTGNSSAGNTRLWLADAKINNLLDDSSVRRRVLLTCGSSSNTYDYTVTNRTEGTFSWSIKPAVSKLALADTRQISLMVSVGDIGATNVVLAQSTLQDENTLTVLGLSKLQLCRSDATSCQSQPFSLPRRASGQPVVLSVSPDFARPGIFKGTIFVAVDQKTDPESFELTVYSSRLRWKVLGGLCIFVGVLIWWLVSVFARQRAARDQALLPLAALSDSIDRLLADLNGAEQQAGQTMGSIRTRLQTIRADLDPSSPGLINVIPGSFPSFPDGGDNAAYQQYVSVRAQQVGAISVLLQQGVTAVLANQPTAIAAGRQAAITSALQSLNTAALQVNTPDDAKAAVQEALRTLVATLAAPAGGQLDAVAMAAHVGMVKGASLPSSTELRLSLNRIGSMVWIIWAMVTLVAGIAALILTNPGFGTPIDYVKCFFWGLSIQAGGQQLQQLTPGSVGTDFKISVPK